VRTSRIIPSWRHLHELNSLSVPFSTGILQSVEGFEPKPDFKLTASRDFFCIDAEGHSIRVIADGITELNEHTIPLILGDPNAKSIPFSFGVEQMKFECGHEPYKALEGMLFACSQRFVKDESGAPLAEIRVSRIIPGSLEQSDQGCFSFLCRTM